VELPCRVKLSKCSLESCLHCYTHTQRCVGTHLNSPIKIVLPGAICGLSSGEELANLTFNSDVTERLLTKACRRYPAKTEDEIYRYGIEEFKMKKENGAAD
jgi:hypothetical protein